MGLLKTVGTKALVCFARVDGKMMGEGTSVAVQLQVSMIPIVDHCHSSDHICWCVACMPNRLRLMAEGGTCEGD